MRELMSSSRTSPSRRSSQSSIENTLLSSLLGLSKKGKASLGWASGEGEKGGGSLPLSEKEGGREGWSLQTQY